MTSPRITAICRVHALLPDAGRVGVTAIDKRAVEGAVRVNAHGLLGDTCMDHDHHGMADQALYFYSDEAAAQWAAELGAEIVPGQFGENIRTAGLAVEDAVVGTVWRLGSDVRVELSKPRIPCATFGRWMQQPQWVKRFTERGLVGAYARVLAGGVITAGDPVRVESVPEHGITIADYFADADGVAVRLSSI